MYQQVLDFLSNGGAITAAVVAVIGLLVKGLNMLGQVMLFHTKHFVDKRYNRLRDVRSNLVKEDALTECLDGAIRLEAFRIGFGIRTSSLKAVALMKLASIGYWDGGQIRRVAKFLVVDPDHPKPFVRITSGDKIAAGIGISVAVGLILIGGVVGVTLILKLAQPFGLFIGLAFLLMLTIAGAFFSTDWRDYKNALLFEKYLKDHPDVFSCEEKGAGDRPELAKQTVNDRESVSVS